MTYHDDEIVYLQEKYSEERSEHLARIKELETERDEWRREANAALERNSELRRKLKTAEDFIKLVARALDVRETEKP